MAGLQVGPPAGSPFGTAAPLRPGMPPTMMDPFRKRLLVPQAQPPMPAQRRGLKRRKMADKVLPQRIRELVPESQAYMDLLAFERKLDQTIARKRMEIQEAIKKPLTQKRKLRIYISNTFSPSKADGDNSGTAGTPGGTPAADKVASWELRVEGKLLDDLFPLSLANRRGSSPHSLRALLSSWTRSCMGLTTIWWSGIGCPPRRKQMAFR